MVLSTESGISSKRTVGIQGAGTIGKELIRQLSALEYIESTEITDINICDRSMTQQQLESLINSTDGRVRSNLHKRIHLIPDPDEFVELSDLLFLMASNTSRHYPELQVMSPKQRRETLADIDTPVGLDYYSVLSRANLKGKRIYVVTNPVNQLVGFLPGNVVGVTADETNFSNVLKRMYDKVFPGLLNGVDLDHNRPYVFGIHGRGMVPNGGMDEKGMAVLWDQLGLHHQGEAVRYTDIPEMNGAIGHGKNRRGVMSEILREWRHYGDSVTFEDDNAAFPMAKACIAALKLTLSETGQGTLVVPYTSESGVSYGFQTPVFVRNGRIRQGLMVEQRMGRMTPFEPADIGDLEPKYTSNDIDLINRTQKYLANQQIEWLRKIGHGADQQTTQQHKKFSLTR